jgi:hypothetical protein
MKDYLVEVMCQLDLASALCADPFEPQARRYTAKKYLLSSRTRHNLG